MVLLRGPCHAILLPAHQNYTRPFLPSLTPFRARRLLDGMALEFACEPPSDKQMKDAEQAVALLEPTVR